MRFNMSGEMFLILMSAILVTSTLGAVLSFRIMKNTTKEKHDNRYIKVHKATQTGNRTIHYGYPVEE